VNTPVVTLTCTSPVPRRTQLSIQTVIDVFPIFLTLEKHHLTADYHRSDETWQFKALAQFSHHASHVNRSRK